MNEFYPEQISPFDPDKYVIAYSVSPNTTVLSQLRPPYCIEFTDLTDLLAMNTVHIIALAC